MRIAKKNNAQVYEHNGLTPKYTSLDKLLTIFMKIHDHVSAAKKDVQNTSVLFTGTAKSSFSTPHISNFWTNCYQI